MSTQLKVKVEISAPPDRIWSVLEDIERWPSWTASISSVKRLDSGIFGLGSRVRIRQPRLPPAVWRVTQWEPGRGFVWESKAPGALTVAEHWILFGQDGPASRGRAGQQAGDGASLHDGDGDGRTGGHQTGVVLQIRQSGVVLFFLSPLIEGITRRYAEMEARGLKSRSEGAAI